MAAWVLLARRPLAGAPDGDEGDLQIDGTQVWNVANGSVVLVEGVALRYGSHFATKLAVGSGAFRDTLIHDDVGVDLYVDPATGEVVDAGLLGCM